jgi:hypothetical protein
VLHRSGDRVTDYFAAVEPGASSAFISFSRD